MGRKYEYATTTTLSAWRPLKDAPAEGTILVKLADGQLKLATATVVTVGFCRHGGDPGWQEAAWVDEGGQVIPDDSTTGWLPIARTYELDRAVQGEIARAFGWFVSRLHVAKQYDEYLAEDWSLPRREEQWKAAIRELRAIHIAMGGRIPDEVP